LVDSGLDIKTAVPGMLRNKMFEYSRHGTPYVTLRRAVARLDDHQLALLLEHAPRRRRTSAGMSPRSVRMRKHGEFWASLKASLRFD
jgi:hypothetical protein